MNSYERIMFRLMAIYIAVDALRNILDRLLQA
jgi:hypothetical protein